MNKPSEFGSTMVQFQIIGLFSESKYREPFTSFVSNTFKTKTNSPTRVGNPSGAISNNCKNKGASVQLSQYDNVSLSSIPSVMWVDEFAAQQINSGKLS